MASNLNLPGSTRCVDFRLRAALIGLIENKLTIGTLHVGGGPDIGHRESDFQSGIRVSNTAPSHYKLCKSHWGSGKGQIPQGI